MKENEERWKQLCRQAANEQDPHKLSELIKEINDLLQKKQARLKPAPPVSSPDDPHD